MWRPRWRSSGISMIGPSLDATPRSARAAARRSERPEYPPQPCPPGSPGIGVRSSTTFSNGPESQGPVHGVGAFGIGRTGFDRPLLRQHGRALSCRPVGEIHRDPRREVVAGVDPHVGPGGLARRPAGLAVDLPVVDGVDELPAEPQPVVPDVVGRPVPGQRPSVRAAERMEVGSVEIRTVAELPQRPGRTDQRQRAILAQPSRLAGRDLSRGRPLDGAPHAAAGSRDWPWPARRGRAGP